MFFPVRHSGKIRARFLFLPHSRHMYKFLKIVVIGSLIVAACVGIANYFDSIMAGSASIVKIGSKRIPVMVADTDHLRSQGLSDMGSLGLYGGMYFKFDDRGIHRMVMRDMLFPLDMVWLDGDKITDIATDLAPEPGKGENDLTIYSNTVPGTAVIEFPAGFVKENGIRVGDKAVLE